MRQQLKSQHWKRHNMLTQLEWALINMKLYHTSSVTYVLLTLDIIIIYKLSTVFNKFVYFILFEITPHYVALAELEITKIHLLLTPECWD